MGEDPVRKLEEEARIAANREILKRAQECSLAALIYRARAFIHEHLHDVFESRNVSVPSDHKLLYAIEMLQLAEEFLPEDEEDQSAAGR